jgi:hypothetical protein
MKIAQENQAQALRDYVTPAHLSQVFATPFDSTWAAVIRYSERHHAAILTQDVGGGLVLLQLNYDGYSRLSFVRASAVVNCHFTLM